MSVEKKRHAASDCLSWKAFIALHSVVDIKKKRKTIKRELLSHLCTVCIVVVWVELV